MSKETRQWLSENTLIGFTEKRLPAWHYREGDNNHYPLAIPVDDVRHRLFNWTAEERPIYLGSHSGVRLDEPIPGRKAVVRADTGGVLGIFGEGYQPHQFNEWLVNNVANILDDELSIGSAGLLRGGAVAWVSMEVPETITTPEGVQYRPNLMAVSSFDGTIATTYKAVVTNVVCDNTMAAGLRETGPVFKVKSTKNSLGRLTDARDALQIVHSIADDFAAEVAGLCSTKISDHDWERIVDKLAPLPKESDEPYGTRAVTMAEKKRDALWGLWRDDPRVSPWRGSAFGAWQAFNTYRHHEGVGGAKPERNMLRAVDGRTEKEDRETMRRVLALV
jgi:phage/plasmid-like protein (TIGR03299 family)